MVCTGEGVDHLLTGAMTAITCRFPDAHESAHNSIILKDCWCLVLTTVKLCQRFIKLLSMGMSMSLVCLTSPQEILHYM